MKQVFALTALLFLSVFVTCYCTYCVFVSNHGLIFLNLVYGETLFPLFFLFSAVTTHPFLFNKMCDSKKSLRWKRFRRILQELVLGKIGGDIITLTSKTLKLIQGVHVRSVSLPLLWSWVLI